MKWTSEWPPEAGWYYCRPLSGEIIVVYVNFVNNFPFAMLDGVAVPVDACKVEWAGPIPEPEEA